MENELSLKKNNLLIGNKMDFYMYKYSCKGWFGKITNINHIVVSENTNKDDIINNATEHSKLATGSQNCDIRLLQKYKMIIYPEKSYSSLTELPFHD
jgi:hypothetical protein